MFVYTIQPVVKPGCTTWFVLPVERTAVRSTRLSNRICQTGCTTRFDNRLNEQCWQQVWQPAVSCIQTFNRFYKPVGCLFTRYSRLSNRLYNRF